MKDLNKAIAVDVLKFCRREVHSAQIYNHLSHWRAKWIHILKLKRLEDVRWFEETPAIMMDNVV
jgi:hypothetical protein